MNFSPSSQNHPSHPLAPKMDQQVISATEFLIGLSDDQIQRHSPHMQRVVSRITQVTKRQLETAESIVRIANENREAIKWFFLEDQTWKILRFPYEAGEDPRTAILSLRSGDRSPLEVFFLRLLACRYLAMGRRHYTADKRESREGASRPRSKVTGTGLLFTREKNFPSKHQTADGLKRGDKFLDIEESVRIPEISLLLLPALPRFDHLHSVEVRKLVGMISNTLKDQATHLSGFLHKYQSLYNHQVGK